MSQSLHYLCSLHPSFVIKIDTSWGCCLYCKIKKTPLFSSCSLISLRDIQGFTGPWDSGHLPINSAVAPCSQLSYFIQFLSTHLSVLLACWLAFIRGVYGIWWIHCWACVRLDDRLVRWYWLLSFINGSFNNRKKSSKKETCNKLS